jgi:small subunit ribosomal protein S8
MTDPIADMLTRMRNALAIERSSVSMPYSRIKEGIAAVLKDEGFIEEYKVTGETKKTLHVYLKYGPDGETIVNCLKRESKPGCRVYMSLPELKRTHVLDGLGIAILTTPRGVMSDRRCRQESVGGEILCTVY